MVKLSWSSIALFFAVMGPGIITATVDNDVGGITTYSLAGAQFGYSLLWSLIPITILLILIQEMSARMGAVTGKGLADLIRENFGLKITFYMMIVLVFVNIANTISEFAGVAAAGEIFGISRYILVPLVGLGVWWLVVKGNYKSVEKIFMFACLFYFAYIISGLLAKPDWGVIGKEIIAPKFQFTMPYLILLIGMIGTTIAPWMQFYLQSSVVEKGIRKEDLKYSKWDVILGCIMTDLVALFIVIATAATIFKVGGSINTAADAAIALGPLAGNWATYLFAFGLLNAGIFAASILPLSTAYSVSEGLGWESGVNRKFSEAKEFYILYTAMIVIGAAVMMIPNLPIIFMMYFSQVLNGILLPVILISMLILSNKKELMGEYKNSKTYNIIVWIISIVIIILIFLMLILPIAQRFL
ncbi:Nramp family divalent metal transporter [Candidatus Pacearchaeota archaeon]|nr:Nramp family divalent metal transporter [Candidatus Pacearchaeota archaeon]